MKSLPDMEVLVQGGTYAIKHSFPKSTSSPKSSDLGLFL